MDLAKFSQYAKHKDGTYVSFEMKKESRDVLDHFVEANLGLSERVNPDSYHITIIYSRTPVPDAEKFAGEVVASGKGTGYEVFPTKTGDKCLVMRIVCPQAEALNKQLKKLGATSDYPDYKAHVTLAYNSELPDSVEDLPVPQFFLEFDTINVAPLDPEFVPSNK